MGEGEEGEIKKARRTGPSLVIYDDIDHRCAPRIRARSKGLAEICTAIRTGKRIDPHEMSTGS